MQENKEKNIERNNTLTNDNNDKLKILIDILNNNKKDDIKKDNDILNKL